MRDKFKVFVPSMLLALLGFVVAYQFVDPAPPSTLTFSAGQKGGAYDAYAARYRDYLARQGIRVEVLESAGTLENIQRLKQGTADIAFVQSDIVNSDGTAALQSLGSMYYEPLWVFLRANSDVQMLRDLVGKRIAVGLQGSGTRALSMRLLKANGIDASNAHLLSLGAGASAAALLRGDADALLLVSAASSAVVQDLQQQDGVRLLNIARAEAYTRRMASLSSLRLPQGTLDLARNIPSHELQLLASTATLVVNAEMHPALQGLVMQAAASIHAGHSLFAAAGTFPTPAYAGIALSPAAQRYYTSGPSYLQRFLPFWAATLVDRLKVMLLPFIALLLPLIKVMPPLYRWRTRSRIYRWYDELGRIDRQLSAGVSTALLDELAAMEAEVKKVEVPLSYAEELYDLRLHLALVREQAESQKDKI